MSRKGLAIPDDVDQRFFTPVLGHAATNVELFGRMADRMPGGSAAKMEEQLFGAVNQDLAPERWPARRYPLIAIKAPWALWRAMRSLQPLADDIERWWAAATGPAGLAQADGAALLGEARERLNRFLGTHFLLTMACQGLMERVAKLAASAGLAGLERDLVRSDEGTAEFELVSDLRALAYGDIDLPRFLGSHGYHGPREGQLDALVWREDPDLVLHLVDAYRQRDGEPTEQSIARSRAEHRAACTRLEKALGPVRSVPARRLVRFAAHAPVWRETGRASILRCVDVGRYAARMHGHALCADGRLDDPDDVFFLTVDEVVHSTSEDLRTLIADRRGQHQTFWNVTLPQVWRGTPDVDTPVAVCSESRTVDGLGVSNGVVEGTVHIVTDQRDADLVEGAVLVCKATDPGWASLFPLVSAVVTDVGSAMSHAAIVCRELGLPCVANTRNGTSRLREGMRVRVDGSAGVVEILEVKENHVGTR